jgi:hypothetical protein
MHNLVSPRQGEESSVSGLELENGVPGQIQAKCIPPVEDVVFLRKKHHQRLRQVTAFVKGTVEFFQR